MGGAFIMVPAALAPHLPSAPRMPARLLLESPVAWACFLVLAVDCGRDLLEQASLGLASSLF